MRDRHYDDSNVREDDIKLNRNIAYGTPVYKSFKERCDEATELLRELTVKHL